MFTDVRACDRQTCLPLIREYKSKDTDKNNDREKDKNNDNKREKVKNKDNEEDKPIGKCSRM